jgi:hypothetical protein
MMNGFVQSEKWTSSFKIFREIKEDIRALLKDGLVLFDFTDIT